MRSAPITRHWVWKHWAKEWDSGVEGRESSVESESSDEEELSVTGSG
jgi:hypothetical protein